MPKKKTGGYQRPPEAQATLDAAMNRILDAFASGNLAEPLAQTYLKGGRHAERWGIWNQILVAIAGANDAATALQWQEMGRVVTDRADKIWLMNPKYGYYTSKADDPDASEETRRYIKGFGHFAVHPYEATAPIPDFVGETYEDLYKLQDRTAFVRSLPLIEVADTWGLTVGTYGGRAGGALGYMRPGQQIGLGVANLSTWAHELVHEADHRSGNMVGAGGQERSNEIVAEWGGAVLLTMLGKESEADWGGALQYIRSYAKDKSPEGLVKEVRSLAWRVQQAINLIMEIAQATVPELVPA
jgi:hypothetical protein